MNLKYLAPYMKAGFQENSLFLGFGSIIEEIKNPLLQKTILECLDNWRTPQDQSTIKSILLEKYQKKDVDEAIELVLARNYVINTDWYDRENPFSRNFLYYALSGATPPEVQENLKKKTVLILGCGGIGNLIGVSLATSGIGKLILVDYDEIEESNLTRQFMFRKEDVGKNKAEILERELLSRSTGVQIEKINDSVSEDMLESLSKPDLIVLSADSLDCLPTVNSYSLKHNIPYINIGYVQDIAVWGPFVIPGETGCFYCQQVIATSDHMDQEVKDRLQRINSKHQAPSNPSVNMLASSLGLMDIIKYLGNFGDIHSLNKRVGIWTHSLKVEVQDCRLNPACKFCSEKQVSQAA